MEEANSEALMIETLPPINSKDCPRLGLETESAQALTMKSTHGSQHLLGTELGSHAEQALQRQPLRTAEHDSIRGNLTPPGADSLWLMGNACPKSAHRNRMLTA